ncbi:hypothetical protein F4802DRAFT_483793 [Xylaria palmicola]|nr:hypothetical protein F4802DRAFT_483793 [Xylaria palmicola]
MTADTQQQQNISAQSAPPKRKRLDSTGCMAESNKRRCLVSSLCLSDDDDTKLLNTIDARYDVQLQSVISSSKIQQRVSAMLRHLAPLAQPTSTDPAVSTVTAKTRISILRAKASEAGKLVSIAEIAKREIEKEQPSSDGVPNEAGRGRKTGRWFQYIALGEELQTRPREQNDTIIEETVLGGRDAREGDRDEDAEFEVMKTPFERAIEGRPLVRGVAVMSLFLSRSPIEELKRRYGEQTNTPTPRKQE